MRLLSLVLLFLAFSFISLAQEKGPGQKTCQEVAYQVETEFEKLFGSSRPVGAEEICYYGLSEEDSIQSLCLEFYYLGCLDGLGEDVGR